MYRAPNFHKSGTSINVTKLEEEFNRELNNYTNDLSDYEMGLGISPKSFSSAKLPSSVDQFRKQRHLIINQALNVPRGKELKIQAEVMKKEMEISLMPEHSFSTIALLLHDFFVRRSQELIVCRYLHMLRWSRFLTRAQQHEQIIDDYKARMSVLLSEYNDAVARAQRLSKATENVHLKENCLSNIKPDDLQIYTKFLITHFHSIRLFNYFFTMIRWLPALKRNELTMKHVVDEINRDSNPFKSKSQNLPSMQESSQSYSLVESCSPFSLAAISKITELQQFSTTDKSVIGGDICSNEVSFGIPLLKTEWTNIKFLIQEWTEKFNIHVDVENVNTSADKMELFAKIKKFFKKLFKNQEDISTFRTYDVPNDSGKKSWNNELLKNTYLKKATWLEFVDVAHKVDAYQLKTLTLLRHRKKMDELLKAQSSFFNLRNVDSVLTTLRQQASIAEDVSAARNVGPKTNIDKVFHDIYIYPDLNIDSNSSKQTSTTPDINFESMVKEKKLQQSTRHGDDYEYTETLQMLGLDDQETNFENSTLNGGYLAYVHLRHLRVRQLQRAALSILNYFRSVERTLTTNSVGLTFSPNDECSIRVPDEQLDSNGDRGSIGILESHGYLYNTPIDYKVDASQFMATASVENHDDFYHYDENGLIHVRDQKGMCIIYDIAKRDFEQLEADLLLFGSHYISKAHSVDRMASKTKRDKLSESYKAISSYGRKFVDRLAVVFDLWNCETSFLEEKRKLLDCYLEVYHNTFNSEDRKRLVQTMHDIIYQRPRFDLDEDYFVKTYRVECLCLTLKTQLVMSMLDRQINEQRDYVSRVCREGDEGFGMPLRSVPKQPIILNSNRSSLSKFYFLEFHPSLAQVGFLEETIETSLQELYDVVTPKTVLERIVLEKMFLEQACNEFQKLSSLGEDYSVQVKKELFAEVFIDDPLFVCEVAETLSANEASSNPQNKQNILISTYNQVLDLILVRHRLIAKAGETAILSKVYRLIAEDMGFEQFHLFMRLNQFEYAQHKPITRRRPSKIQDAEFPIDRFVPSALSLAIHELDDKHVGCFNFRTRDGLLRCFANIESLRICLAAQVCLVASLHSAIDLSNNCFSEKFNSPTSQNELPVRTDRDSPPLTDVRSSRFSDPTLKPGRLAESFVSLQLERTPLRDEMLNEFLIKQKNNTMLMKNPKEVEKTKRSLILNYLSNCLQAMGNHSLRSQIISRISSLLSLLNEYPQLREHYFTIGKPFEKKEADDNITPNKLKDPRSFKLRPRRILSKNGKEFLNLWFIPHPMEILNMFKDFSHEEEHEHLTTLCNIVSCLHDICYFVGAHALCGSAYARLGSQKSQFVSAAWGGVEGIGTELLELQNQLENLPNPSDAESVVTFLQSKRRVMLLEFETVVRYQISSQLIHNDHIKAHKTLTNCMNHGLRNLIKFNARSSTLGNLQIPSSLLFFNELAERVLPWHSFQSSFGMFASSLESTSTIEQSVVKCFAGLRENERQLANGEILSMALQLEDMLQCGDFNFDLSEETTVSENNEEHSEKEHRYSITSFSSSISKTTEPLNAYKSMESYLLLFKILALLREHWGLNQFGFRHFNDMKTFKMFKDAFQKQIHYPSLRVLARKYGVLSDYSLAVTDELNFALPKGATEVELMLKMVIRLIDSLECRMIESVRKKLRTMHAALLSEKAREEGALPTDLWKKPAIAEQFSILRPHIAEDFAEKFLKHSTLKDGNFVINKVEMENFVANLGNQIMERERMNYESYSMFYEPMLRANHKLLCSSENLNDSLCYQMKQLLNDGAVTAHCLCAEQSHALLLEVTALRSKSSEDEKLFEDQRQKTYATAQSDFKSMVEDIFHASYNNTKHVDQYRLNLYDHFSDLVYESKKETLEKFDEIKEKIDESDEIERNIMAEREDQMQILRQNVVSLQSRLYQQSNFQQWKQGLQRKQFNKKIKDLSQSADKRKREKVLLKMIAQEEFEILKTQIDKLKEALSRSEAARADLQKLYNEELREKRERLHAKEQRAKSAKQLDRLKTSNINSLIEQLDESELKLRDMAYSTDKMQAANQYLQQKNDKLIGQLKTSLNQERSIKESAFLRLDELQSCIYESEARSISPMKSRPLTAASTVGALSRCKSASSNVSSNVSTSLVPFRKVRAGTAHGRRVTSANQTKMPRAQTANSRVMLQRSRIARQLFGLEDEPSHREFMTHSPQNLFK